MAGMPPASLLARFSVTMATSSSHAGLRRLHQRGLATSAARQGPPKLNFWDDPLHPSKWKDEHFVVVSVAGWSLLFYGGYWYYIKGKNEDKQEKVKDRSQ
ncbi:hypothetical protein MLD38_035214 [Melastoma candidum]|uniref:Uncharacterized protein n=1 Tax=Melastoma candidum TaxID=119954 RepID=A0ACB9MFL0_9MYRT|nr:hypothetical protein MLD38_035214 [Melastoma candidum]